MAIKDSMIQLAVDMVKGNVNTEFASNSKADNDEALRLALIEANGGSSKLDYRKARYNTELFAIIETILDKVDVQGWENNAFFEQFVDFRNLADGDENYFYIPDNSLFTVNKTAHGINTPIRQRINAGTSQVVTTYLYTVKAYENVRLLMAGRIDIVEFVEKIRKSFDDERRSQIYTTFYNGLSGLPSAFQYSGVYSEAELLAMVEHVEASTGGSAIIVGTKTALAKVTTAVVSEDAKERFNQMGYYGVFNGTPMMMIRQSHTAGTYDFAITNNDVWVVTSDVKPIKFVTEGQSIFEMGSMMDNADQTIDMFAGENFGVGIVLNQLYGHFRIS